MCTHERSTDGKINDFGKIHASKRFIILHLPPFSEFSSDSKTNFCLSKWDLLWKIHYFTIDSVDTSELSCFCSSFSSLTKRPKRKREKCAHVIWRMTFQRLSCICRHLLLSPNKYIWRQQWLLCDADARFHSHAQHLGSCFERRRERRRPKKKKTEFSMTRKMIFENAMKGE